MMCIVPGSFGSPIPRELRDTELVLGLARGFLAPMRYVVNVLQWGRVTSPVRARPKRVAVATHARAAKSLVGL